MNLKITPFTQHYNSELSITPSLKVASSERAHLEFEWQNSLVTGELATLKGLLPLGLTEAMKLCELVAPQSRPQFDLTKPYFGLFEGPKDAQVMFAFESALLLKGVEAFKIHLKASEVKVRELLYTDQKIRKGINFAKVKIGRARLENELSFVEDLLQVNPHCQIRLDPNRLLTLTEIQTVKKWINTHPIEGLELNYYEFTQGNFEGLPLYLDDFPLNFSHSILEEFEGLVLKPTRDGGLSTFFALARHFQVEISSTYESPLGLKAMALACQIAGLTRPQGLATEKFLLN